MVFYGDELVLQFIFAPEDTTERDYEIGGYDSSVVRVSEDGVVHPGFPEHSTMKS